MNSIVYMSIYEILNLTNSVYNFNSKIEIEKNGIKTTYWVGKSCWQVITLSN